VQARRDAAGLTLVATADFHVPYFAWIFDPLTRAVVRSRLRHVLRSLDAVVAAEEPPPAPTRPWWAPPADMTSDQITMIATLSLLLAIVQYGASLFTQTVDFVATTYEVSNAQLGVVTSVARVGTLVALVGSALADRHGRRRVILFSVALVCVASVGSAAAPTLALFALFQVLARGGVNLAFVVGFIAAVEEAPEGARTYTLAVVGIASGVGFALGAMLLPIADLGSEAWRVLYVVAGLGLVFLSGASRRLTETRRYTELAQRDAPRGRVGEVVDRTYGGRFFLLAATGFLLNVFFAPTSQFTNRYLAEERAFSGFGILVLRAVTQGVPAFLAAYAGGRVAESSGRRPVAIWGTILGGAGMAVFFSLGGPVLWFALAVGTAAEALAGPALSAFSTELFPTEVRGTAGAGLLITGVAGSVVGLLLVGFGAEPLGGVGRALALTSIAPAVVAVVLLPRLPEARGRALDDVSPPEV